MKTLELVKTRIQSEGYEPVMKKTNVNGKMAWILKNPETLKWAVISNDEMEELNNLHHISKYGVSVEDDIFTFKF